MMGYVKNIEKETVENNNFRKVVYTAKHSQLVVMSLLPGEEIGEEVHDVDQFLRIEMGKGKAVLDGVEHDVHDDFAIVVPAGARHNVINNNDGQMKLYTIYSGPEHLKDTVHVTKADAMADKNDKFDGTTSE
ncbi:MAG: cupin domain-containing protein [Candidatus Paceibacterales bacterium]